jgi:hypothetical protein
LLLRLRLAAMVGHTADDRVAARRGALIDLLADGRPHTSEAIREQIAARLGDNLWGKRPDEALRRDVAALRRGGVRVAYSRRRGLEGYYLQCPALEGTGPLPEFGRSDTRWVQQLRDMSVAEKNETAFGAADFALRQKRLILREEQPGWSAEEIDRAARRLVFGA